jgi:hypothetical protein
MSRQHRKYYSEVPKLNFEESSYIKSYGNSESKSFKNNHQRFDSQVPVNNFILATSSLTERNETSERDILQKQTPRFLGFQNKQSSTLLKSTISSKRGSAYADSKAFSEIKRSFLDDENEGIPEPLLFLKDIYKNETDPEDEYRTKSLFCVIKVDELIATVLTVNTIFGSVIYHELKKFTEYGEIALDVTLYFVTINSVLLSKIVYLFSIYNDLKIFKLFEII